MANVIRLKRSSLAGKAPATTDLQLGEIAINTTDGKLYLKKSDGGEFIVEVGPVSSVAGRTGAVTLAKADVGLASVDNTADTAKPVSTATQTALNGKANTSHGHVIADVTSLQTSLDAKAPLASPAFTGTPTAPTQTQGNNSTRIATTAYADTLGATKANSAHTHAIADVTSLQATLDGKASSVHGHAIADVTGLQTALDAKAPLASPTFTGAPAAPTAAAYTNTAQLATTAEVYGTVTSVPENAQAGTAYTLALADAGKLVSFNNAAAVTLTIPTNASVAFPVGTRIDLLQYGAGQVTVGGTSVTIRSSGSKLKLSGQYSGATLWKRATDEWVLIGDITA